MDSDAARSADHASSSEDGSSPPDAGPSASWRGGGCSCWEEELEVEEVVAGGLLLRGGADEGGVRMGGAESSGLRTGKSTPWSWEFECDSNVSDTKACLRL